MWKSKILIASFALLSLQACTSTMLDGAFQAEDQGMIWVKADGEGMRAFSDMLAAQAQIAKDSPDKKGSSWQLREAQENVRALKFQFRKKGAQ